MAADAPSEATQPPVVANESLMTCVAVAAPSTSMGCQWMIVPATDAVASSMSSRWLEIS